MTNPFERPAATAPAAGPAQPPWLAQPTPAEQASFAPSTPGGYVPPAAPQYLGQPGPAAPAPAVTPSAPPALDMGQLRSVGVAPEGGAKGAKLADMFGRLALFFPSSVTQRPKNSQFVTDADRASGNLMQDVLTATVVVLDDGNGGQGPITFGGNKTAFPPVPDTETAPLPYVRKNMWINQSKVIGQLSPYIAGPGQAPGMLCGRIFKAGPQHNDPWFIQPASETELQLARFYLQAVQDGRLPHPLA